MNRMCSSCDRRIYRKNTKIPDISRIYPGYMVPGGRFGSEKSLRHTAVFIGFYEKEAIAATRSTTKSIDQDEKQYDFGRPRQKQNHRSRNLRRFAWFAPRRARSDAQPKPRLHALGSRMTFVWQAKLPQIMLFNLREFALC